MKRFLSVLFAALLAAAITFSVTSCGYRISNPNRGGNSRISEIQDLIDRYAIFEFSEEDAEKAMISGLLSGLDDSYTQFWTEEEYEAFTLSNAGHFSGIGVSLKSSDPVSDGLFIYRVFGNSPAEAAGLLAGDRIIAANGVSFLSRPYSEVMNELTGETGENIVLTVVRDGETQDVTVTFAEFVQNYVSYSMIDTVGFIRIHSFMMPAVAEVEGALTELIAQGATGLIFDLRNNQGGSLDAVEDILEFLIPKGEEMVIIQFKNSEEVVYSRNDPMTQVPMAVLLNGTSASASELMASCLRDVNGSALIGTRSFGKGIGQTTFVLSDGSAVKMTTFYYLTKARNYYHGVGLEPDVTVEMTQEQSDYFYALDPSEDSQLQAALSHLKTQISQ